MIQREQENPWITRKKRREIVVDLVKNQRFASRWIRKAGDRWWLCSLLTQAADTLRTCKLSLTSPHFYLKIQRICCFTSPWRPLQHYWLCVSVKVDELTDLLKDVFVVVFHYRAVLLPHLPGRVKAMFPKLSNYTRLTTFSSQVNAGLSSSEFDIEANIRDGDSRAGLDERGTQEVMDIMRRERVK